MKFDFKRFGFDFNLKQSEIGAIIGVEQSVVSNMATGSRKFRMEHLAALRATYGDVVDSYIINESTKQIFTSPEPRQVTATIIPAEVVEDIKTTAHEEVCEVCAAKIPYVKSEIVQSRNIDIKQMIRSNSSRLEYRSMRDILGYDVDYVQKVITAAMMPLFQPGDYLFIQFLPSDAKIISGAIYLIDSKAYGAMVRQVYIDDDVLRLHSLNPDFKELELHRQDVYSISLVVRSMRSDFNMPQSLADFEKIFQKREEQMHRLLSMNESAMREISLQNERMERERERQDSERARLISLIEKKFE